MGKVRYNLKNVHYAPLTAEGTYGEVGAIEGAVSLTITATGESSDFWADGLRWFTDTNNTGYEGSLTVAEIPDSFRKEILGEIEDTKKILVEKSDVVTKAFALGFEVEGNEGSTYFWFYNCTASRPSTEANTTEESKDPDTDTLDWKCSPTADGYVKVRTTAQTAKADKDGWFTQVYMPTITNG